MNCRLNFLMGIAALAINGWPFSQDANRLEAATLAQRQVAERENLVRFANGLSQASTRAAIQKAITLYGHSSSVQRGRCPAVCLSRLTHPCIASLLIYPIFIAADRRLPHPHLR